MYEILRPLMYCERQMFLRDYYLGYILLFFQYLEKGGRALIHIFRFCHEYVIEMVYLLASMFERIIIYNGAYLYCENFREVPLITTEDIEKCMKHKTFIVHEKKDEKKLREYIHQMVEQRKKEYTLLLEEKYDEYLDDVLIKRYDIVKLIDDKEIIRLFYKRIIENFKRTILNKKVVRIHSGIKSVESDFITKILIDYKYTRCMEIGMAFGVSAFAILHASPHITLVSINPF